MPVLAQHLDTKNVGSTTGFMIPEIVKKSLVKGALINHSEHRIPGKQIRELVSRLKKLGMISVVCVKDVSGISHCLNSGICAVCYRKPCSGCRIL
jgi:triosephosphate isomerase